MQNTEIRYSRARLLKLFVQATGLAALLLAALIFINWTQGSQFLIGGIAMALIIMALTCVIKCFSIRPVIQLGPDGFIDHRIMKRPVPWVKIQDLIIKPFGFGKTPLLFAALEFEEDFQHQNYLKGTKKRKHPMSQQYVLTSKLINPIGLDMDQREFLAQLAGCVRAQETRAEQALASSPS